MKHRLILVNTVVAFVLIPVPAQADDVPDGNRWWSHVRFLADDKLEGRNTGSEGHRQAAAYVAEQFERSGLKPASSAGYFQTVKLESKETRRGPFRPVAGPRDEYGTLNSWARCDHRRARKPVSDD